MPRSSLPKPAPSPAAAPPAWFRLKRMFGLKADAPVAPGAHLQVPRIGPAAAMPKVTR